MRNPDPLLVHQGHDVDDPMSWEPSMVFLRLTTAAKMELACGFWITFVGVAVFTGGVRSPVALAFPLFILACGWLISARAALVATGLTSLAAVAMVLAETQGWLPAPPPFLPALHGAIQVILAILSGSLIVFVLRAYRNRLRELHAASTDLAGRTADLEQSKAELHRAQAVARVGSWVFDLQRDHMQLSAETCRIFGLPPGTTGSHAMYLTRVFPGDREVLEEAWAAALRGAGFDHEHRIVLDREVRWIRQKAEFEYAADGALLRAVGVTQDITERRRADERIAELAFFDQLSGLPNRTLLRDRLKQGMAASQRDRSFSALLFLDLDDFKTLNDTRGHDVGDQLLQQVARRLLECVRSGDTVARLGGDEFVVMLVGLGVIETTAAAHAEIVGEKILSVLNQSYQIGNHEHRSTPSIGITLFGGGGPEQIDEPLKRADLAMYQAKAAGRNTLRFFDPEMQAVIGERAALELGLRQALERAEFCVYYQPQVTGEGEVTGAEALVRWRHPVRGMVGPVDFIALAEETALILPLGEWVLGTACAQLAAWGKQLALAHLSMAVNVSARQFRQGDFVERVLAILDHSGADPRLLKLELTESLLVSNVEDIIAKMNALKARGVGFALDDFGTGYSSLSYLSRLPLDQLKIDRSFVMGIESNEKNAVTICAATIGLAHSMGLKVVAEGVETPAQRHVLHTVHHCDLLQGYLFGRPLAPDQFETLVRGG